MEAFQGREHVWNSSPSPYECQSPGSRDASGARAAVCLHVQAKLGNTSDWIPTARLEGQRSACPLAVEESRIEILILTLKTSSASPGCLQAPCGHQARTGTHRFQRTRLDSGLLETASHVPSLPLQTP